MGNTKQEQTTKNIGTVYLYNIDTLHNIILTVHGTSTFDSCDFKHQARGDDHCGRRR